MKDTLKQLADLHDENIDMESIKESLAKKYGHLNWAQVKNKTRKGELDVSDLIAFCDEANRLFYEKEIERLKAEREWISIKDRLPEVGIVLAFQNNEVYVSFFDGITKPAFTYWMPLPDKPKQ